MPKTFDEILAEVNQLPALQSDLATKTDASHAAADNVAQVTQTQASLVQQAMTTQQVAVNQAQAAADTAKSATDAATDTLDTAIDTLVSDLQALQVAKQTPALPAAAPTT